MNVEIGEQLYTAREIQQQTWLGMWLPIQAAMSKPLEVLVQQSLTATRLGVHIETELGSLIHNALQELE